MPYKDPEVRRKFNREYQSKWRKKPENNKKNRAYALWYSRNRRTAEQSNEACRKYRESHKEQYKLQQRKKHLRLKYGLSLEQFNLILASQNGTCAICHTDNWGPYGPVVDHDHLTDKTRGILCNKCNLGIGHLNDSVSLLENAAGYLKKYR